MYTHLDRDGHEENTSNEKLVASKYLADVVSANEEKSTTPSIRTTPDRNQSKISRKEIIKMTPPSVLSAFSIYPQTNLCTII